MARPSKYKSDFPVQAHKLCLLGATDKELADFFLVSLATLNNWKNDYPEFLDALKSGKDLADATVADRLYKRATGYEHDAVKIVADAKTKEEHIVHYTERYPPDTTACIFWLKNRQRDKWRDRVDTTLSGDKENPIAITKIERVIVENAKD